MKTASVREVQHNLAEVLSWIERGEEVLVYRRKKLVARILPPEPDVPASPDFVGRAREIWGETPAGTPLSSVVAEGRDDE